MTDIRPSPDPLRCPTCMAPLGEHEETCHACGTLLPLDPAEVHESSITDVLSGTRLEGRFRLDQKIGIGGMGTVWMAKDLHFNRDVAVKILNNTYAKSAEYVDRFFREAKLLAQLNHPNIVTLFSVGRHQEQPYLVMKLLKGSSLRRIIRGPMAPEQVHDVLKPLCAGVAALHAKGIVHRDLKPANVFVSPEGHVTLLDLGIARTSGSRLTKTGVMYGTPGYMSPEQIAGDKTLEPRTDVYAVGALMFEMLTGRMPFSTESEDNLLLAHLYNPPPRVTQLAPELNPAFDAIIATAMAKLPDDRFGTAEELLAAFERALDTTRPEIKAPPGLDQRTGQKTVPLRARVRAPDTGPTDPDHREEDAPTTRRMGPRPSASRPDGTRRRPLWAFALGGALLAGAALLLLWMRS